MNPLQGSYEDLVMRRRTASEKKIKKRSPLGDLKSPSFILKARESVRRLSPSCLAPNQRKAARRNTSCWCKTAAARSRSKRWSLTARAPGTGRYSPHWLRSRRKSFSRRNKVNFLSECAQMLGPTRSRRYSHMVTPTRTRTGMTIATGVESSNCEL